MHWSLFVKLNTCYMEYMLYGIHVIRNTCYTEYMLYGLADPTHVSQRAAICSCLLVHLNTTVRELRLV